MPDLKFILPAAIALLVLLLFFMGYLKAPPDTAYIISGLGRKRILIGKAGWRVPFFGLGGACARLASLDFVQRPLGQRARCLRTTPF